MGVTKMPDDYVKRSDVHKAFQPKYAPAINRTFAAMIDSVPAADVVEVVRGKWEMNSNYPDRLICSECGAQFDCWHWEVKQMHYCPNCGAKMDGGQDDV